VECGRCAEDKRFALMSSRVKARLRRAGTERSPLEREARLVEGQIPFDFRSGQALRLRCAQPALSEAEWPQDDKPSAVGLKECLQT